LESKRWSAVANGQVVTKVVTGASKGHISGQIVKQVADGLETAFHNGKGDFGLRLTSRSSNVFIPGKWLFGTTFFAIAAY
jgi:hypothetical protein